MEEEEAKKCKNNNNESQAKRSKQMVLAPTTSDYDKVANKEVVKKLAALSIKVRAAEMPFTMQQHALCFTRSFIDDVIAFNNNHHNINRLKPRQLASALKKEFDTKYGAAWHCIVGKSYGSYVTHSNGGFLYFSFDTLFVLLFQTQLQLLTSDDY